MRFVSCLVLAILFTSVASMTARAAFITADVSVLVTPGFDGNEFIDAFEISGTVTSDPAGAETISITGTFDTSNPAEPSLVSGSIIVNEAGGAPYLTGDMTKGVFDFENPLDADEMFFSFTPTGIGGTPEPSAVYAFSPVFEARIDGLSLTDISGGLGFLDGTGSLNISQVPVPATLPLFISGLGALMFWTRRKQRSLPSQR